MATIETATGPWGDGGGGDGSGGGGGGGSIRRRQRPPKIGDIPRHAAVDEESTVGGALESRHVSPAVTATAPLSPALLPPPSPAQRSAPAPTPAHTPVGGARRSSGPAPPPRVVQTHAKVPGMATAAVTPQAAPRGAITSERFRRSPVTPGVPASPIPVTAPVASASAFPAATPRTPSTSIAPCIVPREATPAPAVVAPPAAAATAKTSLAQGAAKAATKAAPGKATGAEVKVLPSIPIAPGGVAGAGAAGGAPSPLASPSPRASPAASASASPRASPRGSPRASPRAGRRPPPLRESQRVSFDRSGSYVMLNQYRLEKDLGKGSFGVVKLAYNQEDDTHYAMKILSKRRLLKKAGVFGRAAPSRASSTTGLSSSGAGAAGQPSPLQRVYREIALLKKLRHPNIVRLVEVLDDPSEDHLYLVFELLERGEVLRVPTDTPLTEAQAWSYFRDALLGVEYLHFQRIVHRDLKPSNLLLAADGRVQIADLGVCSEFEGPDAALSSTVGTPAFQAPEALSGGTARFSGRALDVWALGATLYAFVYGQVPFTADAVPALYRRILNDPVRFPDTPTVSPALRHLVSRMLEKDPSKRITLQQVKEHEWVTAGNTEPLPSEEENCQRVEVTDEEVEAVRDSFPRLGTLCLVKAMLKKHSFQNPYSGGAAGSRRAGSASTERCDGGSGRAALATGVGALAKGGPGATDAFRSGRSHSAPGDCSNRNTSVDGSLPALREVTSPESNKGGMTGGKR